MFRDAFIYAQAKEGEIPDVYVQDPTYFEKYEEEIKKRYGEGVGYLNTVGVHIRRGDYVDNPFYVDLTKTDYYERALQLFPTDNFLVFSDDVDFAEVYMKKILPESRFQVMADQTELEDFNMLASCKSQIIANSSFSWWAGYVNPNWGKTVVSPKLWYTGGIERTKVPSTWIRI